MQRAFSFAKIIPSFILVLVLLFAFSAFAAAESDTFEYKIVDGKAEIILCKENNDSTLQIPQSIDGYKVIGIGESAFKKDLSFTKVLLPEGIEYISDNAFFACSKLQSVAFPNSLESIGDRAFAYCENLSELELCENIKNFGEGAFYSCIKLKRVLFFSTAESISDKMFAHCSDLETFCFNSNTRTVGDNVFFGCDNLKSVFIPSSIDAIGYCAFSFTGTSSMFFEGTKTQWNKLKKNITGNVTVSFKHTHSFAAESGCVLKKGSYGYCKECGFAQYQTKESIVHTYCEKINKATLTSNGSIVKCCEICGYIKNTTTIYKASQISLSASEYVYNSRVKTPSVILKDSKGNALSSDSFSVKYQDGRKAPGKYTVTVTLKGNYKGSKKLVFKILPSVTSKITATAKTTSVKLKWNKVAYATGYRVYQYNSTTCKYEKIASVKESEYTVKGLTSAKTYKFKIKAYSTLEDKTVLWGKTSDYFTVTTKPNTTTLKATSPSTGVIKLSWENVSGESGYQVYYSTSKTGTYRKLADCTKNTTVYSRSTLRKGKTYYFKVRAYINTSSGVVYGAFSSVKSVKVKK